MPYGKLVQLVLDVPPMRHEIVHQRLKPSVMGRLDQMNKLVHDDVFETGGWLTGQIGIQANMPGDGVAAAPFCFHALNEDTLGPDTYQCTPFRK